jgi:hypothetical protein
MNPFENINISFSYDPLFLYLGLILLIFYTVFIYRITLPDVGPAAKSLLIFLRSTSLFLILILIFDPLLRITSERIVEPQTIILVDNSKSISEYADSAQLDKLRELNSGIKSSLGSNADIISFGESFKELKEYTSDALNFSESSTQLEKAGEIFRNYK